MVEVHETGRTRVENFGPLHGILGTRATFHPDNRSCSTEVSSFLERSRDTHKTPA